MAYVLSSVSGNLISAASAGFAPTNSADVSAIASAYQVVTAMATQLNAGSAYVTSINETPISASRAGNAANASLANSAWYDGTGRLISALPDSATVSSIASSYAESAASSKLDTTAFNSADFYTTANESGFITGLPRDITVRHVSASGHVRASSTTADLYGNFDYAGMYFRSGVNRPYNIGLDNTGSNFYIATAKNGYERIYASSIQTWNSYSAKQDALTFGYDTEDRISGINGSAIAGGIDSTTCSAIASSYAESAASSKQDTLSFAYNTADQISSINGSALAGGGGGGSTYTAGNGIDITSDVISVDTSVVATQTDLASKQDTLTAGTNVSITNNVISATDTTYSAGTGIDITNNEISVEAPVDIVAGPGIVIDNPDGNTLRVSTDENYETVLWSGDTGMIIGSSSGSCSLSESAFNFEKIGIYAQGSVVACIELHCFEIGTSPMTFGLVVSQYESNETIFNDACVIGLTGSTLSYSNGSRTELKTNIAHRNDRGPKIAKIVGIHRIANN